MRSWLLIPADNPTKLAKASGLPADVMVVDYQSCGESSDGVRSLVSEWFQAHKRSAAPFQRWLRIKPVNAPQWREELAATMAGAPDGIVMTGVEDPDEIRRLASELYELEQRHAIAPNSIRLLIELGATARGALAIPAITSDPHPRLAGFSWDPDSLALDIGSRRKGDRSAVINHIRTNALLASRALGLIALAARFSDWRDAEWFDRVCTEARGDGFEAMMAVHPSQLERINTAFSPTPEERADAEAIIALFDNSPGASMLPFNGRLLDRAQLIRARRILDTP